MVTKSYFTRIITKGLEGMKESEKWFVYMVECSDGTIYTGITNNVVERIIKHNSGKGAKYTRARGPVILKACWPYKQKSEAAKAEYAFKKLTRKQKMEMISGFDLNGLDDIPC